MLGAQLDAVRLIVDVEDALLNLSVDLLGRVDERLLDISSSLGGCLHEDESVFSSESLSFLLLHLTTRFQVALVSDEHDDHIRV